MPTLKLDKRKYKFTGIVANHKIERKPIIIIIATHKFQVQGKRKFATWSQVAYLFLNRLKTDMRYLSDTKDVSAQKKLGNAYK